VLAKRADHLPTIDELREAHQVFLNNEPRDLFYRAALELVKLARNDHTCLTLGEAVAVLLQTWNRAFYRYRRFSDEHLQDIEGFIDRYWQTLGSFEERSIESFNRADEPTAMDLFGDLEKIVGPVGAAKCLHLLAPRFFPLWDREIATAYGLTLQKTGKNGRLYCQFMQITQRQVEALGGEQAIGRNPLKALDEYNYCRYTKGWI